MPVIITNDNQITTGALISQYARRMTTGQRLAEIIGAFCADAMSSAVNLNADLDVVLYVLVQALLAAFRTRLGPGYATATPGVSRSPSLGTRCALCSSGFLSRACPRTGESSACVTPAGRSR